MTGGDIRYLLSLGRRPSARPWEDEDYEGKWAA